MNWDIFKKWLEQSPINKLIMGLGLAVTVLATSLATIFWLLNSSKDETIEMLRLRLESKDKIITQKDSAIAICREESINRERENVSIERERSRRADSMYYALTAAETALKKVVKDGK